MCLAVCLCVGVGVLVFVIVVWWPALSWCLCGGVMVRCQCGAVLYWCVSLWCVVGVGVGVGGRCGWCGCRHRCTVWWWVVCGVWCVGASVCGVSAVALWAYVCMCVRLCVGMSALVLCGADVWAWCDMVVCMFVAGVLVVCIVMRSCGVLHSGGVVVVCGVVVCIAVVWWCALS